MSLNKVMIIGSLGRDPEVTYTQSGKAVCKLSVATEETWYDKASGEKKSETEWNRITFFGKQAETVGKYFSKGRQIYVEGRLKTTQYEKDGITRYSTDIIGKEFKFIGNNQQGQQQNFQQQQSYQQQGNYQQPSQPQGQPGFQGPQGSGGGYADQDIPFSCNYL